jgi:hypothetical protein
MYDVRCVMYDVKGNDHIKEINTGNTLLNDPSILHHQSPVAQLREFLVMGNN